MMKRSSTPKAPRPRRRSRTPLWLVETLDIVRLRRRLLLSTVVVVVVVGVTATLLAPAVVPTVPVVGAALGFAAVLLGLAVVIAVDAGDLVVRGPRHVRAAGGELVAILPARPGPASIEPLADAALDARGPGSKLILGFATAGDDVDATRRLTDDLAFALARRDVSVLRADLAGGISAGPGLYEVVREEIRLARAVSFETDLKLAWIGPGRDVAGALAATPQVPAMLPSDLDVFLAAFPTVTSKQVVRAAASLDHVLLVVRRGVTSRVDLIAALDALDAAGSIPQIVLLDDRSAQWLGVNTTAAPTAEPEVEPGAQGAAEPDVPAEVEPEVEPEAEPGHQSEAVVASEGEHASRVDDAPGSQEEPLRVEDRTPEQEAAPEEQAAQRSQRASEVPAEMAETATPEAAPPPAPAPSPAPSPPPPPPPPAPAPDPPSSSPPPAAAADPEPGHDPAREPRASSGSPPAGLDVPPLPAILPAGEERVEDRQDAGSPEVSAPSEPPEGVEEADERQAVIPRDVEVMVGAVEAAVAAEVAEHSLDDEDSHELATPHSRILAGGPEPTDPGPTDPEPAELQPIEPEPIDPWAAAVVSLVDDDALVGETHPTDELEPIRLDEPAPDARRRRSTASAEDRAGDTPSDATLQPGDQPADPAEQPELALDPEADHPPDDPLRTTAQMAAILEELEGRDERP